VPEGPEVHREADNIKAAIDGDRPIYIYFHHEHLKSFEKELTSRRVNSVEVHGKGLAVRRTPNYPQ
jgi:endonuclease VIII